ncbi:MAG: DUF1559 domain-containing protein [Lentisphaerae bacterium]|nr:MAG: DUF1559 domain-containing protein [Lentisphaerota bacterium]
MKFFHENAHCPCQRGMPRFTLIELLVVLVIIMILASLLLPALGRARSSALRTSCTNNQKQISMAFVLFIDEHNGELPAGFTNNPGWYSWTSRLAPYLGGKPRTWGASPGVDSFVCPAAPLRAADPTEPLYASNPRLLGDAVWGGRPKSVPLNQVLRPAEVFYIVDCTQKADGTIQWAQILMQPGGKNWWDYPADKGSADVLIPPGLDIDGVEDDQIRYRHLKRAMMLFADGHTEAIGYSDLRLRNMCYNY